MKKFISVCLVCFCLFLAGCSEQVPEENTIAVDKKGVVTYTVVEDFEKDFYDAEELRGDIEKEIADYNQKFGSDPLTLKSFEAEDGKAVMQLQFAEARYYEEYYREFAGAELFVGTPGDAEKAGYQLEGELLGADGSLSDWSQVPELDKVKVLITNEALQIQVPGDIQYVSPSGSVTIQGKKEAAVSEEAGQACIIYK